ncbi:unnamed protein product [Rhodiola kirilowii]
MEGNLNMVPGGGSYVSAVDLRQSVRYNHSQLQPPHTVTDTDPRKGPGLHTSIHDVFPPLSMGAMQDCCRSTPLAEYNKAERGRNVPSDDDEPSLMEDAGNCPSGGGKGAKGSLWHRVKWSDQMVKLLITAVSYIGQDAPSGYGGGGRMKFALMHKKGKWKSISKVMAERGFYVSPQQCEDKFNDLNKRYKRLNEILGRGTSCQVVEKPELLDMMDHLSEKSKEDVRKILSSKHLFYEEMCSYHNGNRLHLPHDPALQRSLHLALESKEVSEISDGRRKSNDDYEEDNHGGESDDCDEFECHTAHGRAMAGISAKKTKQNLSHEEFRFVTAQEGNKVNQIDPHNVYIDMNQSYPEGSKSACYQSQMIQSRSFELEEKRLKIQMEMLELEKQRVKWQKFNQKKDRELEKMRLENERMRLENESVSLVLKQREISLKVDGDFVGIAR